MRSIKLVLLVVCVSQLVGCAALERDVARAQEYARTHPSEGGVYTPAPYPNYYQTYEAPQVWQPEQKSTVRASCNTIGYVTTCKEL